MSHRIILSIIFCFLLAKSWGQQCTPVVNRFAGNGSYSYANNGVPAIDAQLGIIFGIANDVTGNIYLLDNSNNLIQKIDNNGIIRALSSPNGNTPSTNYQDLKNVWLPSPRSLSIDKRGFMYVGINGTAVVEITPDLKARVIAGTPFSNSGTYSGDGGPAISATFAYVSSAVSDGEGNVYISDLTSYRILKVDKNGIITTIVGTGVFGYNGDGRTASTAQINTASSIAIDSQGNLMIADAVNGRIRKIDKNGMITTIAGIGTFGNNGKDGLATQFQFSDPSIIISVDSKDNIFVAEQNGQTVRKIDTNGFITKVLGTGQTGFSGDGGNALNASTNGIVALKYRQSGKFIYR